MSGPTLRSVGLECQGAPTSRASMPELEAPVESAYSASVPLRARASPAQSGGRFGRGAKPPSELEELLHDQDIDPLPIEQALLPVGPHLREAHPLVEGHTRLVGGKAGEDELVEGELPAEVDEPGQHHSSHALAPPAPLHVDGDVGHVVVAPARVERSEEHTSELQSLRHLV